MDNVSKTIDKTKKGLGRVAIFLVVGMLLLLLLIVGSCMAIFGDDDDDDTKVVYTTPVSVSTTESTPAVATETVVVTK